MADELYLASCASDVMSCTDSYVNIILYREKYKTLVCCCNGHILRKYGALRATDADLVRTRTLYGFPLGTGSLKTTIEFLKKDAEKNGLPLVFPLISDKQKLMLERKMPNCFTFTERRDDSDYVYLTKLLATLPGGKFHKKKNHISQFMRKHTDVKLLPLTKQNANEALAIEEEWFNANSGEGDYNKEAERKIIASALPLIDELNL
ncbi:MAG: DUF2156 domain-containing protein, partial [Treponema sp.]|nr:DUF2156 domain-containing protein [Treponema sp.]